VSNIKRILNAVAIAAATSLAMTAAVLAKGGHDKPPSQRPIHNVVQDPTTTGSRAGDETKMFIPPPLDPNYHGSNGG